MSFLKKLRPAFKEALKEWGRVFLTSFATTFSGLLLVAVNSAEFSWRLYVQALAAALLAAVTATVKAVDKYLHKYGKEEGKDSLVKGLYRF